MNVLLVGPTGYIGQRLTLKLLEDKDVHLRLLVRDRRRINDAAQAATDIVEGDLLDEEVLRKAVTGTDVAFFPIRFFIADSTFETFQIRFAEQFRDACCSAGVKKIIYLGVSLSGGSDRTTLQQKDETAEILSGRPDEIQTIWLRAGLVVGSGSALFEIIRNLVQKVPVIFIPRWMSTKIRTVGITDLLEYLVQARFIDGKGNRVITIGPQEQLRFRDMVVIAEEVMGLKRISIPLPFVAHSLFAFLLMLVTPFSYALAFLFVQILKTGDGEQADAHGDDAGESFPGIKPVFFREAFKKAVTRLQQDQVVSRWTDSLLGISYAAPEDELPMAMYRDVRKVNFGDLPPEKIFRAFKTIGGEHGWFTFDILWKIRGMMDKLVGGFGISVGRRDLSDLRVGDMLDVWKVVDLRENERLLLEAQMKVAGKAWLEFRIEGNVLIQTAYHYPKGLLGRLYWYSMLPFHAFIFPDMIKGIVERARDME